MLARELITAINSVQPERVQLLLEQDANPFDVVDLGDGQEAQSAIGALVRSHWLDLNGQRHPLADRVRQAIDDIFQQIPENEAQRQQLLEAQLYVVEQNARRIAVAAGVEEMATAQGRFLSPTTRRAVTDQVQGTQVFLKHLHDSAAWRHTQAGLSPQDADIQEQDVLRHKHRGQQQGHADLESFRIHPSANRYAEINQVSFMNLELPSSHPMPQPLSGRAVLNRRDERMGRDLQANGPAEQPSF